jgi:hypothetical protein
VLPLVADENFNNNVYCGLRRRIPALDIVRVQDAGLSGANDQEILEWAAQQRRILLTHDVNTITRYAYQRVNAGMSMPGVFEVSRKISTGSAIEDIILLVECSNEGEWEGQILFLPIQ